MGRQRKMMRSGRSEERKHNQSDTVDGSEIRRSPVDVENLPLFTGFLYMSGG